MLKRISVITSSSTATAWLSRYLTNRRAVVGLGVSTDGGSPPSRTGSKLSDTFTPLRAARQALQPVRVQPARAETRSAPDAGSPAPAPQRRGGQTQDRRLPGAQAR